LAAPPCASAPLWRRYACWWSWRAAHSRRSSRDAKRWAGCVHGWRGRRGAAPSNGAGRRGL